MRDCFIISPLGAEGSDIRRRADEVLRRYIQPACRQGEWSAIRSVDDHTDRIFDGIIRRLQTAPMVIAYLNRPPWNDNVMVEVGYRLATHLPIVFLSEAPASGGKLDLPFDLTDHRVVPLPEGAPDDEKDREVVRKLIASMAERAKKNTPWVSPHATATISLHLDTEDRTKHMFAEASPEAERLFDVGNLSNVTFDDFFAKLRRLMPTKQYRYFNDEQATLIARLCQPATPLSIPGLSGPPVAETPIVFNERHSQLEYRNRAFLPIILQYYKSSELNLLRLRVFYINVSHLIEEKHGEPGHWICPLLQSTRPIPAPANGTRSRKARPRAEAEARRAFLAFNTQDKDEVDEIAKQLGKKDIVTSRGEDFSWLDDLSWFRSAVSDIVSKVDSIVVFFGPGVSDIWKHEELGILSDLSREHDKSIIAVLLPGRPEVPQRAVPFFAGPTVVFKSKEDAKAIRTLEKRIVDGS